VIRSVPSVAVNPSSLALLAVETSTYLVHGVVPFIAATKLVADSSASAQMSTSPAAAGAATNVNTTQLIVTVSSAVGLVAKSNV